METQQMNRFTGVVMMGLSLLAFLTVLTGYFQAPQADEGTAAHIFQLAIVVLVPVGVLFIATMDWTKPRRSIWPLVVSGVAVILAFAALYYLEHVYYAHYYH